ncbi:MULTISPECIES: VOC family protein [Olivibacter]|jgi:predicted enzyme related to lactoylglutathione lyase|uniref:Glyoxalase/bleomycin resistance protein/dioxygenase n=2 Tax=Sphingobacteriaceae TaxID=84566 RepID=F4CEH6_SPHS2|nr:MULTISPECIES: VOC family protein [Olivibacter]MDM8174038.1 VOC family protein [Olivibacter sp. 47]QEL03824.1 glyoxalase [Olivibacter sp. LS-1]
MKVKRIVANIETDNIELAATFYGDVLGLQNVMNHGWIATYASSEESGTQVSFASQGGDGLPVPYLSIEVDDLDQALTEITKHGFEIIYGPSHEPWGVRRFFVKDPFDNIINILSHE